MKLDLKKVEITGIDGAKQQKELDYKGLANFIFNQTQDIGELEIAREIYKNGEVTLNSNEAVAMKRYIQEAFHVIVQEALLPQIDRIINQQ